MSTETNPDPEIREEKTDQPGACIDRPFTYAVSVASLLVGLVIAAGVGLPLLGLGQLAAVDAAGKDSFSPGQLVLPIVLIVTVAILYWSIFNLPVRVARRRGVILDPEVWPSTGAILIGVLVVIGFVGAMLAGVI